MPRRLLTAVLAAALAACATVRPPIEQRTTQGPDAQTLWAYRIIALNGREPTFDERRSWESQIDARISEYLRQHPEVANSLEISTFRFYRQVAVGMAKDQVMILFGAPLGVTTDEGEMEKLARRYWPEIKGNATEAWVYPLGWRLYFAGQRLVDITQYLPR